MAEPYDPPVTIDRRKKKPRKPVPQTINRGLKADKGSSVTQADKAAEPSLAYKLGVSTFSGTRGQGARERESITDEYQKKQSHKRKAAAARNAGTGAIQTKKDFGIDIRRKKTKETTTTINKSGGAKLAKSMDKGLSKRKKK